MYHYGISKTITRKMHRQGITMKILTLPEFEQLTYMLVKEVVHLTATF